VQTAALAGAALASTLLLAFLGTPSTRCSSPWFYLPHLLLCALARRSGLFAASAAALLLTAGRCLRRRSAWARSTGDSGGRRHGAVGGLRLQPARHPPADQRADRRTAANERRWQLALDVSKIGLGDWDLRAGRIEFSRWLAMLGHRPQGFGDTMQAFWAQLHPDDVRACARRSNRCAAARAVSCRVECRMRCRDGRWKLFELHALVAEHGPDGSTARGRPPRATSPSCSPRVNRKPCRTACSPPARGPADHGPAARASM
jgi:PAS domain-containing protein